jgi:hypothetical protein
MLNLQSQFTKLFGSAALPMLDELFFDELQQAEDPRPQLFQMLSTSRELDQSLEMDSLGVFSIKGEGEQAAKDSLQQGYTKNFSQITYAKAIGFSREMIADDRWSLISKATKSLARSAQETKNLLAMNIFNNAFSAETSSDGVAIISASHPSQIGNQSNTLAAPADISVAALKEMEKIFRSTQDARGKRMNIKPAVLLVSESDRHAAIEFIQSPYKAETANNNINSLGMTGSGLKVISSPYLTDADAYFMLANPSDHGLKIYDRQKLETRTSEDELAGVLYYVADFRQSVGCDKWRGIVGTAGA